MIRIQKAHAATLALLAGAWTALAADTPLGVGDPAPKLKVAAWVQGEAVTEFARDKAYLVEFWATWCPPCRASIPHLNEIWQKFKDRGLVVIGQNDGEDESKARSFIKLMGDKMTYRVALDDQANTMAMTWMKAAGQRTIPFAFLVDKQGRIAWMGGPMDLPEAVIEQVLDGKYDLEKAKAEDRIRKETDAKLARLVPEFDQQMEEKKWDAADATLTEIGKLMPETRQTAVSVARLPILVGKGELAAALALVDSLSEKNKTNATALANLAWKLVTDEHLQGKLLAAGYQLAVKANEVAGGKDPIVLDTLARATFLQGDKETAVALERKAVDVADNDSLKRPLRATLDSYKDGKLPLAN